MSILIVMDENVSRSSPNRNQNQISSFVLDHLFSSSTRAASSSTTSPHFTDGSALYLPPIPVPAMSQEFDPSSLAHHHGSRGKIPEAVDHDSESEEGVDVFDEPSNQSGGSRSSGSKRSRAADVHNLSEKRRRSRINEKMKALQSLIPNSNKTDKASMLDEAIEYLKQLQIQVQMLSVRNGMSLSPAFLPGGLSAIQPSEMRMGYGVNGGSPIMNMSMGGGVLPPITQDSLTPQHQQHPILLPNQCPPSVCSIVPPKDVPVITYNSEPSLAHQPPSNPQHSPFNLSTTSGDVYVKGIGLQPGLGSSHGPRQATISNTAEANHDQRQAVMREYTM